MIAECSESSVYDSTSLMGSQSHANLNEFDEDNMSQFSRADSADSHPEEEDMEIGDNPVSIYSWLCLLLFSISDAGFVF